MHVTPLDIQQQLARFESISLAELEMEPLMNRFDQKFIGPKASLGSLLSALQPSHRILEINGKRMSRYETRYYDTPEFTMYHNHHRGKLNRFKVRKRRYVDSDECFLEIKAKTNKRRTDKRRIPSSYLERSFNGSESEFIAQHTSYGTLYLTPSLETSFERITLFDPVHLERITLDISLSFEQKQRRTRAADLLIVELKSSKSGHSGIRNLLKDHGIHRSRFSKYCMGMALQSPEVKRNLMNPQLRKVERLTPLELTI